MLGALEGDERLAQNHRLTSVGAHLLEIAGETEAAREAYRKAARLTARLPAAASQVAFYVALFPLFAALTLIGRRLRNVTGLA